MEKVQLFKYFKSSQLSNILESVSNEELVNENDIHISSVYNSLYERIASNAELDNQDLINVIRAMEGEISHLLRNSFKG